MAAKTKVDTVEPRVVWWLDYGDGYLQGPYYTEQTAKEHQDEVLASDWLTSHSEQGPLLVRAEYSFVDDAPEGRQVLLPGEA